MSICACKRDALFDEIDTTEDVDEGVGPVLFGPRARYIDENGVVWYCAVHGFGPGDERWLKAWTSGENPELVIMDTMPPTWKPADA